MEAKYNLKHAKEILEPCGLLGENQRGKYLRIKKRGVMPAIKRDLLLQTETEGLRWRPARQLQLLPGAPEVKGTPMLPNPFTARELAAFMLEGAGALVADFYGEWDDGPDPESLRAIDPDSKARRAVTEAFTAYRLAIEKVGKYDMDALARRDAAHTAYWKSSNDKALLKAFEDAEAEWDAAYQAWLTKMVRCLLEPQAAAPALHVATEPTLEQRQAYRWHLCIDAGLTMPEDTYSHLPRGIGKVAESLGITRQALQQDLSAHRERLFGK